jgi:outer membrane protein OmpA-like peptidoglycan-associated protein
MGTTGSKRFLLVLLAGVLVAGGALPGCNKTNPSGSGPGAAAGTGGKAGVQPVKTSPDVSPLQIGEVVELPFLLWGGDVATFHANGGLETRPNTIFHKHGLRFKLTPGDDFDKQVEKYMKGTCPFLRGTMSMLGQESEKLGQDSRTQPVVFLQLTWSAGDHLVARSNLNMLNDLRGKKIALQKGGPHVGMLHDILRTANLNRSDIKVVDTKDVDGPDGPAAAFRKDPTIDACFAISPEMTELTGGLDKTGDGTKDSVRGAHVLVSTAHMSRSIADVYACRKDYYDKYRDVVDKLTAGYLKASEDLMAMKKAQGEPYKAILKLTQDIYGKDKIKTLDDADGLIADAAFVGLPGNMSFFTNKGNLSGFEAKQRAALDTALAEGDIKTKIDFIKANLDYAKIKQLGSLTEKPLPENRFNPNLKFLPQNTIFFFTINFQPNQSDFSAAQYGQDFQRALEMASLFGKTLMVVRGHADPTLLLQNFAKAGQGANLDMTKMKQVLDRIATANLTNLQEQVNFLKKLSDDRSATVRQSVVSYAESKGYLLDKSQMRYEGVGVLEPAVTKVNANNEEMASNRRVEFRIIRISLEDFPAGDIDY